MGAIFEERRGDSLSLLRIIDFLFLIQTKILVHHSISASVNQANRTTTTTQYPLFVLVRSRRLFVLVRSKQNIKTQYRANPLLSQRLSECWPRIFFRLSKQQQWEFESFHILKIWSEDSIWWHYFQIQIDSGSAKWVQTVILPVKMKHVSVAIIFCLNLSLIKKRMSSMSQFKSKISTNYFFKWLEYSFAFLFVFSIDNKCDTDSKQINRFSMAWYPWWFLPVVELWKKYSNSSIYL